MLSGLNSRRICSTTNSLSSIIIFSSYGQDDTEIRSILLLSRTIYLLEWESYDRKVMSQGTVKNTVYSMEWFIFVSMMNRITASVLKVSDQCRFLYANHRTCHYNLFVRFSPALVSVCVRYVDASYNICSLAPNIYKNIKLLYFHYLPRTLLQL